MTTFNALTCQGCAFPVEKAQLQQGEIVLDLGCGFGSDALVAARQVGSTGCVYGLDKDKEKLGVAEHAASSQGIGNVRFIEGSIEQLPLEGASFDVIVSNCVINLSTSKELALSEAYRVLKPGGRLIIADIISLATPIPEEAQLLAASVFGCTQGVIAKEEYLLLLKAAGFSSVECELYQRFELDRISSRAQKHRLSNVLEALKDPAFAKTVHGLFASVYLWGEKL